MEDTTEAWRKCWRDGFAPQISTEGLRALAKALAEDDSRLLQGATCSPPPLQSCRDWPVEACCPVTWTGWQGDGLEGVAEVEDYFARMCLKADNALGELAGCRWLLNWIDNTPREQMRHELLAEVRRELHLRDLAEQGLPF